MVSTVRRNMAGIRLATVLCFGDEKRTQHSERCHVISQGEDLIAHSRRVL